MHKTKLPQFPYGAVYFRKSNPPGGDWERDYEQAAKDGMNVFRHWFMWGNIEVAPQEYDWADYDRHLDLAAQNGLKTIISEMLIFIPEWMYRTHPHLLEQRADGSKVRSVINGSSATGGASEGSSGGALCLDCDEAKDRAGAFLTELVLRYKDHPAMLGYDVWNECNYNSDIGYHPATQAKFRQWLLQKYGGLRQVANAWRRYSLAEWEDVKAPFQMGPYPECIDWLQFKKMNFQSHLQWRVDLIRSLDSRNHVTAHGIAASLTQMAGNGTDDWLNAEKVDSYGLTWVVARKGSEPWKQANAIDLVRGASRDKTFWHAEMQGGPLWLQPEVVGREKEDGRVATPEDIRLWNLTSIAGGARGILYLRWRSLLDGPLFGAFGLYDTDGLPNVRSEMASRIARWANDEQQAALLASKPVKGDIGIIVVPESQLWSHLLPQAKEGRFYTRCAQGAYRAFLQHNIQADWVRFEHIDEYDRLYLPYPIMLTSEQSEKLKLWVKRGGTLLSEGCTAYFGENGTVGVKQPNYGLHDMFGAVQREVEFMPDLGSRIEFESCGLRVKGGLFRQSYTATAGTVLGTYADGSAAVVEHTYGEGRTVLIGTFPSEAFDRTQDEATGLFFVRLLERSGADQLVTVSDPRVRARLQAGAGGKFIWLLNPHAEQIEVEVAIHTAFGSRLKAAHVHWGSFDGSLDNNRFSAVVPAKDALVLQLQDF